MLPGESQTGFVAEVGAAMEILIPLLTFAAIGGVFMVVFAAFRILCEDW